MYPLFYSKMNGGLKRKIPEDDNTECPSKRKKMIKKN